jgi:hypothetical protein
MQLLSVGAVGHLASLVLDRLTQLVTVLAKWGQHLVQ